MRKRLEKAQVAEDERNMYDDAPVKYSIEFLALNAAEIRKFMDYFEKIDKDHTGFITPDELFAYIGERRCEYGTSLFKMLDSFDADGKLDFGEFMKAVGTFCLFGKEEVTRFTYSVFDEDNSGSITHGELLQLLSTRQQHATECSARSRRLTCRRILSSPTPTSRRFRLNSPTCSSPRFACKTRCGRHFSE